MPYDREKADKRYKEKHRAEIIEKARAYNLTHKVQQKDWREKNKIELAQKAKIRAIARKKEIAKYQEEYYCTHKDAKKKYDKGYSKVNKAKRYIQSREWKRAHPEVISGYSHKRYLKHRVHILEVSKQWKQANPAKINAMAACRRAAIVKATPPWLTEAHWQQIEAVYAEASRISRATSVEHHVDHVYPLQGRKAKGLHVPWNLQVLVGSENYSKSNKLPVLSESNLK